MGISQAALRYLLTIYELSADGTAVRSVDSSRRLEVTPASVVHMLGVLSAEGLAEKRYYGKVRLTERGIREANRLYTACALLKAYFTEYLEVDSETARADAVNCLCCLSERSLAQIEGKVLEERGCTA